MPKTAASRGRSGLSPDSPGNADQRPHADVVAFLSSPQAYPDTRGRIERRETHMSWIFLVGQTAYKLKKPVRFPYLDFSTLARREAACRAELLLNRRLAPRVYCGLVAIKATALGLSLSGPGRTVDWLVKMRRLDDDGTLEQAIMRGRVASWEMDQLAATLAHFYRKARPVSVVPARHLADWRRALAYNRKVLLDRRLGMPSGLIRQIDAVQREFLATRSDLLAARCRRRFIIDGHGDLRPEHIWLGDPTEIIDCLEFDARLRAVDPFEELAFLDLECRRLGAAWIGEYLHRRLAAALRNAPPRELFLFYRSYRAMLRARLAIAHLLEANPRTPEKWPALARKYLRLARTDAKQLEFLLRRPADRSGRDFGAADGWFRPAAARREPPSTSRASRAI